jgi:hypothetical protein
MKKQISLGLILILLSVCFGFSNCNELNGGNRISGEGQTENKSNSFKGLVMAGYQGWFNAEGDGADRGWNHYRKGQKFEPGYCSIDFWPEMSEYPVRYKSPFTFEDGTPATLFSSYDESTVDLHFKWMQEYGIDGVFIQRFITNLKSTVGYNHNQKVLSSAFKSAKKYDRIICIMYDLSGMESGDVEVFKEDWRKLVKQYDLLGKNRINQYLSHNEKPLVAIWGAGFNDGRKYNLNDVNKIVDFVKNDPEYGGFSIMLGIPTYWRTLSQDTQPDEFLHTIIKKVDIIHIWHVGRYNEETYPNFKPLIDQDIAWCKQNNIGYVPTVFPGFSWHNMKPDSKSNQTPRNKGNFLWKQMAGAISEGAEMLYVAMFDEIDEGTAIFKCAHKVPSGESIFVPIEEEVPSDHYLWLTGQATKMLRKEIPFTNVTPIRK